MQAIVQVLVNLFYLREKLTMCSIIKYNLCRLCLCRGGFLMDICEENGNLDFVVEDTIQDLLRFRVIKEDGFPWNVCQNCLEKLADFRLFKRRCIECKITFESRVYEEHWSKKSTHELSDGGEDASPNGPVAIGHREVAGIDTHEAEHCNGPGSKGDWSISIIKEEEIMEDELRTTEELTGVEEQEAPKANEIIPPSSGPLVSDFDTWKFPGEFGARDTVYVLESAIDSKTSLNSIQCHVQDLKQPLICQVSPVTAQSLDDMDQDDSGIQTSAITAKNSVCGEHVNMQLDAKPKRIRQRDICYYCEDSVLSLVKHISRKHPLEIEVEKILSKPKKSKERKSLLSSLRKKGNYVLNANGCPRPMKKTSRSKSSDEFLPCPHCLGFYSRKRLWRHSKKCVERPTTNSSKPFSQVDAQSLLVNDSGVDQKLKEEVFPRMRADSISLVAKKDVLICEFGAQYLKLHEEKRFIGVTSLKMRQIAKLLIEATKLEPSIKNLFHALQPKYFDLIVKATKTAAGYDREKNTFAAPSFALKISNSLKHCCDYALNKKECYAFMQSPGAEANLQTMIQLLTSNWKNEICSQEADDLNSKRLNKVKLIPLANDLKILKEYLSEKANFAAAKLKSNNSDEISYSELLETVLCRVLLLNQKRHGELQRMLLHVYQSSETKGMNYEELDQSISVTEKVLMQNFKCITVQGVDGGFPVLFSLDVQDHIKMLIQVRSNFVARANPYLFGKPYSNTYLCVHETLEKYVKECRGAGANAIKSTRLGKHLATLTQILSMSKSDIKQLASLTGHISIQKCLPGDAYQTAKIYKIVMLMEKGEDEQFKGKALYEIKVNIYDKLPFEDEVEDFTGDFDPLDEPALSEYYSADPL